MSSFNPYEPPAYQGPAQDLTAPGEAPLASRWARLGAAFIDGLLSMIIVLPLQAQMGIFENFPKVTPLTMAQRAGWGVAGFVIWFALHAYFLATRGQTIGKRLLSIQIVNDADGLRAPFGRIIALRHLPTAVVANIPYIGPLLNVVNLLTIFRDDRRCIHDLIAGTKVVEYRAPAPRVP